MTMTSMKRTAAVLAAILTVGAVAGCATASAPPDQTTSPSPQTSTPVPSPTETPPPDPDDLSTWLISDQGMGPIVLGAAFDEARAAVPAWKVGDQCSWTAFFNFEDGSATAYFAQDSDNPAGVTTIDVSALVETVDPADGPRTAEGVGLGSTRADVQTAYPDATEQPATIGEATLLRAAADSPIFFTFRAGADTVSSVTVTSRDEPPYEVCG